MFCNNVDFLGSHPRLLYGLTPESRLGWVNYALVVLLDCLISQKPLPFPRKEWKG